ncbi:MAG TPA: hypothetical protein VF625_06280 [Longimicrobium sp.]
MFGREMPRTRGAEKYRKLLGILRIAAGIGVLISVYALYSMTSEVGFNLARLDGREVAVEGTILLGWTVVAWIADRGIRHNIIVPEWVILVGVLLGWVVLFLQRMG